MSAAELILIVLSAFAAASVTCWLLLTASMNYFLRDSGLSEDEIDQLDGRTTTNRNL